MTHKRCNAVPAALSKPLGPMEGLTRATVVAAGTGGLTAIEAAAVTGLDRYSLQPRLSELRRKGLVVDSGKRRRNPSGRQAIVWIARELVSTADDNASPA